MNTAPVHTRLSDSLRRRRANAARGGFTLVEVVVALVIVASAFLPLMASLGSSAEKVLDATLHRKMRYLMQIQAADVEIQQIKPPGEGEDEEDAERYEEGSRGTFEAFASEDMPGEYDAFTWEVEIYREELICGGSDDPEALEEAGFETGPSGEIIGRPVSNDPRDEGEEEPEGQMKRLMVLTVRCEGEDADHDLAYRIMTYLPIPGEEDRQIGGEATGAVPPPGGAEAGGDAKAGGASGEVSAPGGKR